MRLRQLIFSFLALLVVMYIGSVCYLGSHSSVRGLFLSLSEGSSDIHYHRNIRREEQTSNHPIVFDASTTSTNFEFKEEEAVLVDEISFTEVGHSIDEDNTEEDLMAITSLPHSDSLLDTIYLSHDHDHESVNIDVSVTLITQFYLLPVSKYSAETYISWMKHFLTRLDANMVVFTNKESLSIIKKEVNLRNTTRFTIDVEDPFNHEPMKHFNKSFWENQQQLDPEKSNSILSLYGIWSSKSYLCKRVAKENPFNSRYFFWVDIGGIRKDGPILQWPDPQRLKEIFIPGREDWPLFSAVFEPDPSDTLITHDDPPNRKDVIQGAFYGGTSIAIDLLFESYWSYVQIHGDRSEFVAKDQNVLSSVLFTGEIDNALIIPSWKSACGAERWFFFLEFLMDRKLLSCSSDEEATALVALSLKQDIKEVYSFSSDKLVISHTFTGRSGNEMFQWASLEGIANSHNMTICFNDKTADLGEYFVGPFPPMCNSSYPVAHVYERGFGIFTKFRLKFSTCVGGYLQSFKYFQSINDTIEARLRFKPEIQSEAEGYIANNVTPEKRHLVAIHVRQGDFGSMSDPYLRFPPSGYFIRAMDFFRVKYNGNVTFIISSDDPEWCLKYDAFQQSSDEVHIIPRGNPYHLDFAILNLCEDMITTRGTFGWWIGYLIHLRTGGDVIHYENEFVLNHPVIRDYFKPEDYFPPFFTSMSGVFNEPVDIIAAILLSGDINDQTTKSNVLQSFYERYEPSISSVKINAYGTKTASFKFIFVRTIEGTSSSHFDSDSRTLWLAAPAEQDKLAIKMKKLLLEISFMFDFHFFLKIDDDTIICLHDIVERISTLSEEKLDHYYGGYRVDSDPGGYGPYMMAPSYMIGRKLFMNMIGRYEYLPAYDPNEAALVGQWLAPGKPEFDVWSMPSDDCNKVSDLNYYFWYHCNPSINIAQAIETCNMREMP